MPFGAPEPMAIVRLFGANASEWNLSPCIRIVARSPGLLLAMFQIFAVASWLLDATRQRSDENVSAMTPPTWPFRLATSLAGFVGTAEPAGLFGCIGARSLTGRFWSQHILPHDSR